MEKNLRGAVFDYHFSKFLVAIRALFCLNECVGSEFTYRDANQDSSIIAYTIWYKSIYINILGNFNKYEYIVNIVLDIPKELEPSFLQKDSLAQIHNVIWSLCSLCNGEFMQLMNPLFFSFHSLLEVAKRVSQTGMGHGLRAKRTRNLLFYCRLWFY